MEGGGTPYSSSMAPSGSYILIIVSQPVTDDHKKLILDRLNKGLLSWDVDSTGCDLSGLETVCADITAKHLNDTDVLIQHSTESLGVEVLVSPTVSTLKQCVKNLFSTATGHKHLIHAGYTFAGSGSWVLQNGAFSFHEFLELYKESHNKSCNVNVHCAELGAWTRSDFPTNVHLNPEPKVEMVPGAEHLQGCLERVLSPQALEDIMEASALVGNIRFNRPTLYLFPAGQGDCALFGINGFNMLVDGGFNRKPCAWEFIRHLDRLDAVLVTRLCENNVCGMSTLMKRKSLNNTYPQIGYVFCNIAENEGGLSSPSKADMLKYDDDLVVSVVKEGHAFTNTLNELKLKPHNCWRDSSIDPFVLYHKVGHGTLEMHVLSPPKDSKEMKDFLSEWSSYKETFSSIKSGMKSKTLEGSIPLSHATSICAVLVWRPADPKDTITRILFPGSAPQSKIFESLDKLKALDVLKQPVVTKESLSVVTKVTKTVGKSVPNRKNTASPALSVSSVASRNGDVTGMVKKEVVKKVVKEVKKDNKDLVVKKEVVKKEVKKEVAKKAESVVKKDTPKKEVAKEPKKEVVKKIVKKEVKAPAEKKPAPKKTDTASPVTKTVSEVKKTAATAVRKSTTPVKKDVTKPAAAPKKPAPSKVSEPKTAKDVSNKKAAEAKSVPKTKPKTTPTAASKTASTPKAPKTPSSTSKTTTTTTSSMTKAVAASSIVASAVAVTAAAFEMNEKKEEIVAEPPENNKEAEVEAEVVPADVEEEQPKEVVPEKPEEVLQESQMPPEALSPTPSESVSLTPSDTLSSAPLETVSPTPPLGNEPMSMEEKEVNEIKEIDQDLEEEAPEEEPAEDDIEAELARRQKNDDMMSMSFVGMEEEEPPVEEEQVVCKTEAAQFASAPSTASQHNEEEPVDDEDKEIDSAAEKVDVEDEKAAVEKDDDVVENDEKDVDDQLAHMSMEGSYCAGRPYDQEILAQVEELKNRQQEEQYDDDDDVQEKGDLGAEKEEGTNKEFYVEEQQENNLMSQSFIAENGHDDVDDDYENKEVLDVEEEQIQPSHASSTMAATSSHFEDDNQFHHHHQDRFESEELEKEVEEEKEINNKDTFCQETYDNNKFEYGDNRYDDDYRNIIADSDMQESSVDEPEEIVRKESAVSITLNDEVAGNYDDDMRRKSCTESEDDVDIQRYMSTTATDGAGDNLGVGRDSDNEDVVKSPTPHAVVDFDVDAATKSPLEKKDLDDEKDRDSAEDDDGEMVRHPTPPYSEDEMRDPIGPHFITTPGLTQGGGITEEPLYEEENEGSERSISPVVEQPVFGNTAQADFPELVTVSGGTTPSEPQSPKSGGFGTNKFAGTEAAAVMDALSEHDCSESSAAHSPLVHEEADAFDMPVVEEKQQDENLEKYSTKDHDMIQSESTVPAQSGDVESYESEMIHKESAQSYESKYEQKDVAESYESQMIQKEVAESFESQNEVPESYESQMKHEEVAPSYDSQYEKKESCESEMIHKEVAESYESEMIHKEVAESYESEMIHKEVAESHESEMIHKDVAESYESEMIQKELDESCESQNEIPESYESQMEHKDVAPSYESQYGHKESYDSEIVQKEVPESYESQMIQKEAAESYESQMEHREFAESHEFQMAQKEEFRESPVLQKLGDESEEMIHEEMTCESEVPQQTGDSLPSTTQLTTEAVIEKHDNESEDESYSQNDQSETRSEKSDIHKDDKSDNQHDGKDDDQFERRSDLHDDDRSDSHYDDKQDDYDSKGADSYDMQEGTRSHVLHDDQQYAGVDDYEMKQEMLQNIQGGDAFDRQSLTDSPNYQQGDEFDTNSASVSEISQIKTEAYEQHSEGVLKYDGPHEELNVPSVVDSSKLLSSEVHPDDFTVPSGFKDDQYSTGVSQTALDQFDSSPAHQLDSSKVEDFVASEKLESTSSQNDFDLNPLSKHESEYQTYQDNMDEEVRMVQQRESETTSKNDEYREFRWEMLQNNSDQQSYNLSSADHSDDVVAPQHTEGVSSYENMTLTEMTEAHQHETLSKFEENVHTSTAAYSESSTTSNVVYEEEDPNFNYSSNDLMRPTQQEFHRDFDHEKELVYSQESSHFGVPEQSTYHHGDVTETKDEATYHHHQEFDASEDHHNGLTNGKEWNHSTTHEISSTVTESHAGGYTNAETSYIINSRFHSDSPEDNIMRSDSSPDVPPYPLDASGQMIKHFEQSEVDYSNMNALPPSPVKAMHTHHRDNYPSSDEEEDEDSSSIPGTVSPYAYTNKAYAKEEEDIDGNHIYSKETTIEKTSSTFDDNQFATTHQQVIHETGQANYDFRLEEWDKPLGLPTPPETKVVAKKTAPKTANGKLSASPLKKPKTSKEPSSSPVYLDLAYVPHHGDPRYCDVEFFKKIRARYYVFSGINPSKEVLNALLEAKKSWKEDLEVTIIPTYETDTLGYWMAQNQEDLAEYSIEVAPSASRCTVNLQDHATSCAAYRLEF